MSSAPQGKRARAPRPRRSSVMLTQSEKAAVELVAETDGMTASDLLRGCTVAEIWERAEQIVAESFIEPEPAS